MAASSPESDLGSIECFQNYTAPEVFVQGLAGQINQQDVEAIIRAQKQMLQRFEKTNEMLSNCNSLSASRFAAAQTEFKKHTALLHDMKKDLDTIFKRIRTLKTKISAQYPKAFAEATAQEFSLQEEEEEGDGKSSSTSADKNQNPTVTSKTDDDSVVQKTKAKEENLGKVTEDSPRKAPSSSSDSQSSSPKLSSSSSFDN
ncbi:kxDL motif-containing protein CG10681 [Oratosquilla oratoria]|uniref:kxDL motif-containing protein CG10681 n=1 Tax=Oratosquilla oratoria TaxID=337810 RepID=UPI003F76ACA0